MAQRIFILLLLFISIINVNAQFYDLFQGFPPFRQNYQQQPEYSVITHTIPITGIRNDDRPTNRRRPILSIISDDVQEDNTRSTAKPKRKITSFEIFNLDHTTSKPIRKTNKNSSQRNPGNKVSNKNAQLSSNRRQFYDDSVNNVADYSIEKPTTKRNYGTMRPNNAITRPTATSRPNYATKTRPTITSRPSYENSQPHSTQNPLYNRPGVKPAVVDSNRPPITNRPATNRPFAVYPKPTDSSAIRFPEEPDTSPEVVVGPDEDMMSSAEKRRYIDMAEKMCDKYKALNVRKVEAIPLLPSPEPVRVNVSGCQPTNVPLVVGGKVVTIEEFPHMALLGWTKLQGGGYSWKCGGSLISDQFVLTAGHCASQEKDDSVVPGAARVVQLGSSYLDDTGALVMRVLQVVRHPKYIQTRSYYDIALVKLVQPVTFSQVVKPACLGAPPGIGEPIIATGWGRTEFGGSQSLELRSVSVPVWDMDECKNVLGTSRKLPNGPSRDSQICAGEKNGGKDTCQGDSGGPAQIQDGCAWRVVAVTSLGRSCGAPNTPALYATLQRAFIAAQIFGKTTSTNQNNAQNSWNTNSNDHQNKPSNNGNRDGIVYPNSRPNSNNNDIDRPDSNTNSRPNSNNENNRHGSNTNYTPNSNNENSGHEILYPNSRHDSNNNNRHGNENVNFNSRPDQNDNTYRPSQNSNNGINRQDENANHNTNNNRFGTGVYQNHSPNYQNNQGSWNSNPQTDSSNWNNNGNRNTNNNNDRSYQNWNSNNNNKQDNYGSYSNNDRTNEGSVNAEKTGQYDYDRHGYDGFSNENTRRPSYNNRENRNQNVGSYVPTKRTPSNGGWWSNYGY